MDMPRCMQNPNYRGNGPDAVVFDENRGTRFSTLVRIKSTDGSLSATDSIVELSGGTEALVFCLHCYKL